MTTNRLPQNFYELLADSDVGRQILAHQSRAKAATRKAAAAELAQAHADIDQKMPDILAEIADATAAVVDAENFAKLANQRLRDAAVDQHNASVRFDAVRFRQERILRETADPAIDEFIARMRTEFDVTRNTSPIERENVVNAVSGDVMRVTTSNINAIRVRLIAIQCAISDAEKLKLEIVDDVAKHLAEIEANILPIGMPEPLPADVTFYRPGPDVCPGPLTAWSKSLNTAWLAKT